MKSAKEGAIYNPPKICPLAVRKEQKCPSGRPPGRPANGHFYDRCASSRPPGRPAPTREWGAFSQSTGRIGWLCARPRAHRSTGPPVDLAGIFGIENLSF